MNLALGLALVASTLSFSAAIAHFAIARAPGWRATRRFAWIALSAGCYSLGNLLPPLRGMPAAGILADARWAFAIAHWHSLAWLPFAFGDADANSRSLPRAITAFMWISGALGVFMAVSGMNVDGTVHTVAVPWAHVVYTYVGTTPLGDAYTSFIALSLLVPYAGIIRRALRGEPEMWAVVLGFTAFLLSAAVEALVAEGTVATLSPADIGFLAVVLPTSVLLMRRFFTDARRLDELSRDLAGQVALRTAERDRAEIALAGAERLDALGRLAAGVGHEVNNPLTYMRSGLDRLRVHLDATRAPADVSEALDLASEGAERIRRVVGSLQGYALRTRERRPQRVEDLVRSAIAAAGPAMGAVSRVETDLDAACVVAGDERALVQVLTHLLVNAAQALDRRPEPRRITARTLARRDGEVVVEIEDNGPGMPEHVQSRIAEPYFTTRAAAGAHGLGLFVTRGVVEAHGGRLEFEPAFPSGTRARVTLPVLSPEEVRVTNGRAVGRPERPGVMLADPPVSVARERAPRRGRILVADDERLVLGMLAQLLSMDYEVTAAAGGAEAIAELERGSFDAVICDVMMPGVSGMDVAQAMEARWPGMLRRTVFLTGGAVTPESVAFLDRPDVASLQKPVNRMHLLGALHAALADGPVARSAHAPLAQSLCESERE